jgi:hypothetical protein
LIILIIKRLWISLEKYTVNTFHTTFEFNLLSSSMEKPIKNTMSMKYFKILYPLFCS